MAKKAMDTVNEDLMNADLSEIEEKAVTEETVAVDPWKEKRKIRLPKAPKGQENYLIASVNGRVFKIRKGEEVEVPLPIAQVVENSFIDADAADEFIEQKVFE